MIENRFYVYAYYDVFENGLPFYIGKGCGNRHLEHTEPSNLKKQTMMACKLRSMLRADNNPVIEIMKGNLQELYALQIEMKLIAWYGRRDLGTGCLRNHTDGGDGVSGIIRSAETCLKLSLAHLGVEKSIDHRVSMSKPHSAVAKENMRAANHNHLSVYSYSLTTGETIKIYPSIRSTELDGYRAASVSHVLHRIQNTHGGVGWRIYTAPTVQSDASWEGLECEFDEEGS